MMSDLLNCSDEKLIEALESGIVDAEEILLKRHLITVKCIAREYYLRGGDTEDLIQEGWLGLYSAIKHFDSSLNIPFSSYAKVCIKRSIYSAERNDNSKKNSFLNESDSLDLFEEETMLNASDFSGQHRFNPESVFLELESSKEFKELLTTILSEYENSVFGLFIDGYSYREMAAYLNKSERSVGNAIQRIRRKLSDNPNIGVISDS